jgi:hypothetical protein
MVEWVAGRLLNNDLHTKIEVKEIGLPLAYAN